MYKVLQCVFGHLFFFLHGQYISIASPFTCQTDVVCLVCERCGERCQQTLVMNARAFVSKMRDTGGCLGEEGASLCDVRPVERDKTKKAREFELHGGKKQPKREGEREERIEAGGLRMVKRTEAQVILKGVLSLETSTIIFLKSKISLYRLRITRVPVLTS